MSQAVILSNAVCRAVVSTAGAELQSLQREGLEYLWQGDPRYWEQHSPLLFPFVGRFTEGKYRLFGREYPMGIHGFAAASEFAIKEQDADHVTLLLRDNRETFASYPFHFELEVTYELAGAALSVRYLVKNTSGEPMFFGIGGHPGFRVPLEAGTEFTDYRLDFHLPHRPERVGHTPACFLSGRDTEFALEEGRYLPLRHELFDDDAIVLRHMSRRVTLGSEKTDRSVTMEFPDLPYLGIWHRPKTDAPYVCIEPWTSLPSRQDVVEEFSAKSDLIRLEAGGLYRNGWRVTLQ